MSAADIMLFPSLYEGLPLTLIEAQASGLPIIMSNNISSESILTKLIKVVPLEVSLWVKEIAKSNLIKNRLNYNNKLCKTNMNIDFQVSEIIREKIILNTIGNI